MDLDAIRLEVFRQTGISIEKDDPFFAALLMLSTIGDGIARNHEAALERIAGIANALSVSNQAHRGEQAASLKAMADRIEQAVGRITDVQGGIAEAAANQAAEILSPITANTTAVLSKLNSKDQLASTVLARVQETTFQWAKNAGWALASVFVALVVVGGCAFFAGRTITQKETLRRVEWLESEEGRHALQLKEAGSLTALATCNAGPFKNDWTKSKDGRICFPNPTDGSLIGWRLSR